MRSISLIRNARLRGRPSLTDIHLRDGRIERLDEATNTTPSADAPPTTSESLDADGMLVVPRFVDPHVHLDLAYTFDPANPNRSGTLVEAIRLWREAKATITAEDTTRRACLAIADEVRHGVGLIRTHVDVASSSGLRLVEGMLAARERTAHLVDIEVVAFPQDGLVQDPGAVDNLREAMRLGCDVIGGIAHNERTERASGRHIEILFELAAEFDAPIDCHIDETDAPESRCVERLAAGVLRRGRTRVTASHVCALSSYSEPHASKVVALIAEAGLHVVCNPCVNLHLQGRFDRYPKRRGITRVDDLRRAGVNVAAGQDCIRDPFYPLGTGNMLDVAHMLVHADHLSGPEQLEFAFDAVTTNAAGALDVEDVIEPGAVANLVCVDAPDVHEAIRTHRPPRFVVRHGAAIEPSDLETLT